MRLDGLPLDGGGGGGGAAVTATAAATVTQNGLALVTLGVTAGGGDGSYSYVWTLFDPLGVDRSVLLSSSTVAESLSDFRIAAGVTSSPQRLSAKARCGCGCRPAFCQ